MIPAGGSGKLTAKITTKPGQNGPVSKSIMVYTDGPQADRIHRLTLRFTAKTAVTVLPRFHVYLRATEGETASERVVLRRDDGVPLEVIEAEPDVTEMLDASWRTVKEGEEPDVEPPPRPGDVVLELATVEGLAPSRRSGRIRIRTNHPKGAELELPYTLLIRPRIEARPAEARLWVSDGSLAGRQTAVRLSSTVGTGFLIRDIEVSAPGIVTATATSEGLAVHHTIAVRLAEGADLEQIALPTRGWIRIRTSDADQPLVEVPLLVTYDRSGRRTGQRRMPRPPAAAADGS